MRHAILAGSGLVALILAVLGAFVATRAVGDGDPAAPLQRANAGVRLQHAATGEDTVVARLLAEAPFRANRRAAVVRYRPDAAEAETETGAPAAIVRPQLRLGGFVMSGGHAAVIVEGLPEAGGGVLLGVGDSARGVTLVRLDHRSATLRGFDTTWVLSLQHQERP